MRCLLSACLVTLLCWPIATVTAQEIVIPDVDYPELSATAATPEGFVPGGWVLEQKLTGDLDKDGDADAVLLIRQNDPANVVTHGGLGEDPLDTNPRILAAVVKEKGGYRLAASDHQFIARRVDPVMSDPLSETGGLSIDRGSLKADLYFFMSAGGSDTSVRTFRFRLTDGAFRLIGFEEALTNRMSGATQKVSINYLTGKAIIETGSIESDEVETTTRKLRKKPLLTMAEVGDGILFEPQY